MKNFTGGRSSVTTLEPSHGQPKASWPPHSELHWHYCNTMHTWHCAFIIQSKLIHGITKLLCLPCVWRHCNSYKTNLSLPIGWFRKWKNGIFKSEPSGRLCKVCHSWGWAICTQCLFTDHIPLPICSGTVPRRLIGLHGSKWALQPLSTCLLTENAPKHLLCHPFPHLFLLPGPSKKSSVPAENNLPLSTRIVKFIIHITYVSLLIQFIPLKVLDY